MTVPFEAQDKPRKQMCYGQQSRVPGVLLAVEFEYFIEIIIARTHSSLDEQDENMENEAKISKN